MGTDNLVILIAEADTGHFTLVKKNLWRCCGGSDIIRFKNGKEILDFIFMKGSGIKIMSGRSYLLLLDIELPEVDGIEVLRQIKASKDICNIPVIMLATSAGPEQVRLCHKIGCNFYIVKPVHYNDFVQLMKCLGVFLCMDGIRMPVIEYCEEAGISADTES